MELPELLKIIQGGGNLALVVCCYFIWKASERLARIEKALDKFIETVANK